MPEEDMNKDVSEETNPDEIGDDEILNLLSKINKEDNSSSDENKESEEGKEKPFLKKVGNLTFDSEEKYDAWVLKQNGEVSRLTGELNKATKDHKDNPTKQTELDIEAIRMKIKVEDFFEENPDAVELRPVIAALLRTNKAKTLQEAMIQAKKAVGMEVQEEKEDDDTKSLLKSGSSNSSVANGAYSSKEEVDGISDFANKALLSRH